MEFSNPATLGLLLTVAICAAAGGCSSSDGYVDYASLDVLTGSGDLEAAAADSALSSSANPAVTATSPATENQSVDKSPSELSNAADASAVARLSPANKAIVQADAADSRANVQHAVAAVTESDRSSHDDNTVSTGPRPAGDTPLKLAPMIDQTDAVSAASKTTSVGNAEAETTESKASNSTTPDKVSGDAADPLPTEPLEIKLLIPERRLRPEGDSGAIRLSYDDIDLLKILNMEPVPGDAANYFPAWLKELDGQSVRIRGFMYPTFEATGLTAFTMARDNGICCFVRQPKIYDVIAVRLADGQTTDYIEGKSFDVEGVFRIAPESEDNELYQLYRIEDARVLRNGK